MTNEEYRERYDAKMKYRKEHPQEYPYFAYFQFGWHRMEYISKEEKDEYVKTYKLWENGDGWQRVGRQPIFITRRK